MLILRTKRQGVLVCKAYAVNKVSQTDGLVRLLLKRQSYTLDDRLSSFD